MEKFEIFDYSYIEVYSSKKALETEIKIEIPR